MKIKKFNIVRPEVEVCFVRPIIGRLYLLANFPRFIKFIKLNVQMNIAKHEPVAYMKIRYLCIPKFKVVEHIEEV